jgi:hypothetical protein
VSSVAETAKILTSTNPLQIGGDSTYGQYFKGLIDAVRVYNVPLTATQIQTDMNTPISTPAPSVTGHTPLSSATNVAVTADPAATFNEVVQSSSIVFTLQNSAGTSVAATVAYNASTNTATLTPKSPLAYGTTYTATMSGAQSISGAAMAPVSWSFTTDAAQPVVTTETPAAGATGVSVSTAPTATFNEAVQTSTITFTLASSGTSVAGTVAYNSTTHTATFTPKTALAYSTTYTATVSGAKDTAGDAMNGTVTWSFTTASNTAAATATSTTSVQPSATALKQVSPAHPATAAMTSASDRTDAAIASLPAEELISALPTTFFEALVQDQLPSKQKSK